MIPATDASAPIATVVYLDGAQAGQQAQAQQPPAEPAVEPVVVAPAD